MHCWKKSPHIIGLSECELKKSIVKVETLQVPGYDIIFPKSWYEEGFARIVVYVKKSFQYEHIEVLESNLVQSIGIRGHFRKKWKYLLLSCIQGTFERKAIVISETNSWNILKPMGPCPWAWKYHWWQWSSCVPWHEFR